MRFEVGKETSMHNNVVRKVLENVQAKQIPGNSQCLTSCTSRTLYPGVIKVYLVKAGIRIDKKKT